MRAPKVPPGWRLEITPGRTEVIEHPETDELHRVDGRRWPLICNRGQLKETVAAVVAGNPICTQLQIADAPRSGADADEPKPTTQLADASGRREQ